MQGIQELPILSLQLFFFLVFIWLCLVLVPARGSLIMADKLSCSVACGNLSTPCAQSLSPVWLFVTPWTVACQALLSIGFSQQEYWSGLPFPPPGNLPEWGIEPMSPVLTGRFFSTVPSGESLVIQFSSVQLLSCIWLCDPMDCSKPGLPAHHQLPVFTRTHVHCQWVSDAIQPSHPLSSPSPPALNLSQHQGLFKWVRSSHQVAKVLQFQLQHQSFQWAPRTDLL